MDRRILVRGYTLALIVVATLLAACDSQLTLEVDLEPPAEPAPPRGELVGSSRIASFTVDEIARGLEARGAGGSIVLRHGVSVYAVTYRTVDVQGMPTLASGLVFLPQAVDSPVPLYAYQHGTTTVKTGGATDTGTVVVGTAFAATGGVVAATDYLGLGASAALPHPYLHAASEASAALDALRAARRLAAREGVPVSEQLFLFGYSQGGHATMALHREIEHRAAAEFSVTASAPMAGPYDMVGSALRYFHDPDANRDAARFALFLLASWQHVYELAPTLGDMLLSPWDGVAETLVARGLAFAELQKAVPDRPVTMLRPEWVARQLADSSSAFASALRENNVYDWRPRAPVRLYYGTADRSVPHANALTAAARMRELGADVQAVDLGPLDHGAASVPAVRAAHRWFASLRR